MPHCLRRSAGLWFHPRLVGSSLMPLTVSRRRLLAAGAVIPLATPAVVANAAVPGAPTVRIGVLTALTGEYADAAGYGSVEGTKMAVEVFVDMPNSAVALAVATLTREKNKVALYVGAGTDKLTGEACSPNHLHWL